MLLKDKNIAREKTRKVKLRAKSTTGEMVVS
jgi:hypothetical protein